MTHLNPSEEVDIGALAGLFRATTNSYKHLFFQGLLAVLRGRDSGARLIPLSEIGVEMVALAWYPHSYFGVSFGRQDQVSRVLYRLAFSPEGSAIGNVPNQEALRRAIRNQSETIDLGSLLRFVPYRLLTPFFADQLAGMPDTARNQRIRTLASEEFQHRRPLYRFVELEGEPAIEVHPAWMAYLQGNQAIVEGWAERQWLAFLQSRNPSTPALTEKIRPPTRRSPLTAQTRFWQAVTEQQRVPCLYSGQLLGPGEFALDHFVPWAFVCHDKPWNLAPVQPEVNAAKGHSLPHPDYIPYLAQIQAEGLATFRDQVGAESNRYGQFTEPYLADLGLAEADLIHPDTLGDAYQTTLAPLLALARRSGFPPDWTYQ